MSETRRRNRAKFSKKKKSVRFYNRNNLDVISEEEGDEQIFEQERKPKTKKFTKVLWIKLWKGKEDDKVHLVTEEAGLKSQKSVEKAEAKKQEKAESKKKKKKRKTWKKIRHAALVTCRYMGFGVGSMVPIGGAYPYSSDYFTDPYSLNYSSTYSSYNHYANPEPSWVRGMLYSGW